MEFFKSIFGRKDKPQSKASQEPQTPAQEVPAQETPAVAEKPVQQAVLSANTSSSDAIRKALDIACQTLAADPAAGTINVLRLLMGVRAQVDDATCGYQDFDAVLAKAVEQIPSFCLKNTDNYAQVTDYVRQLEEAVKARRFTKESVDKYEPKMDTCYYQLKLIYLRGHLYTLLLEMTEKQQWLASIDAKPQEEQAAYLIPRLTCQGYLNSAEMQKKNLNSQIAAYDAALINARHMVFSDGPVDIVNLTALFDVLNQRSVQFQKDMIAFDQESNMYLAQLAAQTEELMETAIRHQAGQEQQDKQAAEIGALQDMIANKISGHSAQPQAQAPQEQPQAPQAQAPQTENPMTM